MANRGCSAVCFLFLVCVISRIQCFVPGYSFAKFMGPVSGAEKKVVYDDGKYKQHDYVAKPDYHFEYGVKDPKSKVHQTRQETRHGDTVQDPDGKFRTVKYTADKESGFQASVITDGHVVHHPQDPVKPIHEIPVQHVPQEPTHHEGADEGDEYEEEGDGEDEGEGEGGDDEDYDDEGEGEGEGEDEGEGEGEGDEEAESGENETEGDDDEYY